MEKDYTPDYARALSLFTTNERSRYDLSKPFVIDGSVYATNGHIAIKIPADQYTPDELSVNHPQAFKLWEQDEMLDTPVVVEVSVMQTKALDKLADADEECGCEGGLCSACDCGTSHDCGDCDGTETVYIYPYPTVDWNVSQFNYRYIRIVAQAAKMLGNTSLTITRREENGRWLLSGKNVDFAVMPQRHGSVPRTAVIGKIEERSR